MTIMVSGNVVGQYKSYGPGNVSCRVWLEESVKDSDEKLIYIAYVQGYLSAMGVYKELKHADTSAIQAYMDKYCTENPLYKIMYGADSLLEELYK
jgi:hypothetical protein